MITVILFDQNRSRFASFDMPELPRKGDVIEIALPTPIEDTFVIAKSFIVERVVHRMVYEYPHVKNETDTPWRWEIRLHGTLRPATEDTKTLAATL